MNLAVPPLIAGHDHETAYGLGAIGANLALAAIVVAIIATISIGRGA